MLEKTYDEKKEAILKLAEQLPTGRLDTAALKKYEREFSEMVAAVRENDAIGILLEAADCLYYLVKAEDNGLISSNEAKWKLRHRVLPTARFFTMDQVVAACIAKYTLRARPGNPKDDDAERAAVETIV